MSRHPLDERLAGRREHLMTELGAAQAVATEGRRSTRRRRAIVIAASLALVVGVGAPVAAHTSLLSRDGKGVHVDGSQLGVVYHGKTISMSEYKALQAKGKAQFMTIGGDTASRGLVYAFDTPEELDAWDVAHRGTAPKAP